MLFVVAIEVVIKVIVGITVTVLGFSVIGIVTATLSAVAVSTVVGMILGIAEVDISKRNKYCLQVIRYYSHSWL